MLCASELDVSVEQKRGGRGVMGAGGGGGGGGGDGDGGGNHSITAPSQWPVKYNMAQA